MDDRELRESLRRNLGNPDYIQQIRDEADRIKAIKQRVEWAKEGELPHPIFHYAGDCQFLLNLLERDV